MSRIRSYFKKSNTLITNNTTNNSQNPVTEISYGTYDGCVSRYIFDIDFSLLRKRIERGIIIQNNIKKHILHMTNTIGRDLKYVGKKSYSEMIERASSFELEVFNLSEDWDEGNGYDLLYDDTFADKSSKHASNWFNRKTNLFWNVDGVYSTGNTEIIGNKRFEKGNENIEIDITDYVNQRLFENEYSGNTVFSGDSFGLGIKFLDLYESLETDFRHAVAFHTNKTNTWYEPYVETIYDDIILDDRNYFYLDKKNRLYLYTNYISILNNNEIIVNHVNIYDNNNNFIETISGDSITNVGNGIYFVEYKINSNEYPDSVLFVDEWNLTMNGVESNYYSKFYLISPEKYFIINEESQLNLENYHFNFWGIKESEQIKSGDIRKIKISVKELYTNQNNFIPLNIEYRVYIKISDGYEIDVIPFTSVNRTKFGYYFNLDTSWLIPQVYYIQIKLKSGEYFDIKQPLSFEIVNDGFF